jgi:hypothetical protein
MAAAIAGCGEHDELSDEETSSAESALIVNSTNSSDGIRRPPRLQNTITIPVCWQTSGSETEKGWVETAIANTWGANSWIVFTFAPTCPDGFWGEGTKIEILPQNPGTTGLGAAVRRMVLNFTFVGFGEGGGGPLDCRGADRRRCIEESATHEFGHLIGFAHESYHPDYERCSPTHRPLSGTPGDLPMGPLDLGSIMSQCDNLHSHSGPILSPNDVAWVRRLFGGGTIDHGGLFALRRAAGTFARFTTQLSPPPLAYRQPSSSSRIVETDGTRNLVRLRKATGTGTIVYGDKVSIQDARTGLYYCFVDFGAMGSGIVGLTGPCSWEVRRPGAVGGSTLNVNDPVTFRWPTTFNGNPVFLHSDHFWLLGPIPPA